MSGMCRGWYYLRNGRVAIRPGLCCIILGSDSRQSVFVPHFTIRFFVFPFFLVLFWSFTSVRASMLSYFWLSSVGALLSVHNVVFHVGM